MALIAWLLEQGGRLMERRHQGIADLSFQVRSSLRCANANCVTRHEGGYLGPRFALSRGGDGSRLMLRCVYCERELGVEFVGHVRSRRYYRFDESLRSYVRQWIEEGSLAVFDTVKEAEESGYEPYRRGPQREVMSAGEISRALENLAEQIASSVSDIASLVIAGVVSRGVIVAFRLCDIIAAHTGIRPPCIVVDV
jgi:hypothetical protein